MSTCLNNLDLIFSCKQKPALLMLFCSLLLAGCAQPHRLDTQPVDTSNRLSNVSYGGLLVLPYEQRSIRLAYGDDPLQFGQLYLPEPSNLSAPLVVFIHGGCWLSTYDISHSKAFSQALAAQGFAVWSIEYRRSSDKGGGWPGSFEDVLAALSFVDRGLAHYPVDSSRLILAGHSAGGHLALLAAGHAYAYSESYPYVHAVVGLAAITDLVAYASGDNSCQRASLQFMGGTVADIPEQYQQANPQQQVLHPASILLQGSTDSIVPLSQAIDSSLPYNIINDAGHFDWIHPHTQAYKQVVLTLQELLAQ